MQLAPARLCSYLMVHLLNKRTQVPVVFALPLSNPSRELDTNPPEPSWVWKSSSKETAASPSSASLGAGAVPSHGEETTVHPRSEEQVLLQ